MSWSRSTGFGAATVLMFVPIVACATAAPPPRGGQDLMRAKCSGCHRLYTANEILKPGWQSRIGEMARRAKMTEEEKDRLVSYISQWPSQSPGR